MTTIRDTCPLCGGPLALVQVECQQCHTHFEGSAVAFAATPPPAPPVPPVPPTPPTSPRPEADLGRFGALARLSRDQLAFAETFIRARGIIKTAEAMLGISYPTVRSKLDDVIATMGLSPSDDAIAGDARREQREILAELAEGRISPEEAHGLLRRLVRNDEPEGPVPPEEKAAL